jgi:hypothetical protein
LTDDTLAQIKHSLPSWRSSSIPGSPSSAWGGFAAYFSHPALIAVAIVTCFLSSAWLLSSGNLNPGEREDRANRWVLLVFGLIGLLDTYLPAYTDRTGFWTMDGEAIRWLGVALFDPADHRAQQG